MCTLPVETAASFWTLTPQHDHSCEIPCVPHPGSACESKDVWCWSTFAAAFLGSTVPHFPGVLYGSTEHNKTRPSTCTFCLSARLPQLKVQVVKAKPLHAERSDLESLIQQLIVPQPQSAHALKGHRDHALANTTRIDGTKRGRPRLSSEDLPVGEHLGEQTVSIVHRSFGPSGHNTCTQVLAGTIQEAETFFIRGPTLVRFAVERGNFVGRVTSFRFQSTAIHERFPHGCTGPHSCTRSVNCVCVLHSSIGCGSTHEQGPSTEEASDPRSRRLCAPQKIWAVKKIHTQSWE